jgi:hypothetical protein
VKKNPLNEPGRARLRLVTDLPAQEDRHLIDESELQRRLTDAFERGAKYGYECGLRAARDGELQAVVEAVRA